MKKREPNFENMKKVLAGKTPDRPVLFELFMNTAYYERLSGSKLPENADSMERILKTIEGFHAAGYDYCTVYASQYSFIPPEYAENTHKKTISLNDQVVFCDRESYDKYTWPNPCDFEDGRLDKVTPYLPEGMKLMCMGPGGVLENIISLLGYDNLCYLLFDDPDLVKEVSDHVGQRLLEYYLPAVQHENVGFICCNDDWGFNTQTMISPDDLRKYVFPWHKKIVELAHRYNKPCILHSCGNFSEIIEDVIEDMGFDARHSYEDKIMPVEEAYEKYNGRIAILGGIDMNYISRQTPENVYRRSRDMLERSAQRGGYALGTGNSVPEYVPYENYLAMLQAAYDFK